MKTKNSEYAQYVFDKYILSQTNVTVKENEREILIINIKKAVTKLLQLNKIQGNGLVGTIRIYPSLRIDYYVDAANQKIYSANKELPPNGDFIEIQLQ